MSCEKSYFYSAFIIFVLPIGKCGFDSNNDTDPNDFASDYTYNHTDNTSNNFSSIHSNNFNDSGCKLHYVANIGHCTTYSSIY